MSFPAAFLSRRARRGLALLCALVAVGLFGAGLDRLPQPVADALQQLRTWLHPSPGRHRATAPPHAEARPAAIALRGVATVVDGDTLILRGERIRLDGIDAPEGRQTCSRNGYPWRCGADASAALETKLRGRQVACTDNGRDQYGRMLSHCWVGEEDIGAWMVREGFAVAYTRYSMRYAPEQELARRDRRGLWGGQFEMPEAWRRAHPR